MCMCTPNLRMPFCPNCNAAWLDRQKDVPATSLRDQALITYLARAGQHADTYSRCKKVKVGALIIDIHQRPMYGANYVMPGRCVTRETCEVNGHCISTIHAEIAAIAQAKRDLHKATIYVTRYPCEACARAIVVAGITKVVYGRPAIISETTRAIFAENRVEVVHVHEYKEEGDDVI